MTAERACAVVTANNSIPPPFFLPPAVARTDTATSYRSMSASPAIWTSATTSVELTSVVDRTVTRGSTSPFRSQLACAVALYPDPNTCTCNRSPRLPADGFVDVTDGPVGGGPLPNC